MFMQIVFSKVHPACHNIANGIKPRSSSKKTDKHAAHCQKPDMLGRNVIFVRCINCTYNNVVNGIRLLDKKAIFVYTGKFHASKSFRKIYPHNMVCPHVCGDNLRAYA